MESSRPAVFLQGSSYLDLARLPNIITIAADILAGYWIANGLRFDSRLLWLLLAASSVYAAGCALNDYCDRAVGSPESPGRPISGGRAERWKTFIHCSALFTVGLGASALAGASAPQLTILLILVVLLYNLGTKEKSILGPLTMGGYRSLNLILGMGLPFWLGLDGLPSRYFPVFSFFYVFLLCWLSRFEAGGEIKGNHRRGFFRVGPFYHHTSVPLVLGSHEPGKFALPRSFCGVHRPDFVERRPAFDRFCGRGCSENDGSGNPSSRRGLLLRDPGFRGGSSSRPLHRYRLCVSI